jgi:hypothetical protein
MGVIRVDRPRWRGLLVMGETGSVLAVNQLTDSRLLPTAIVAARGRSNLRSISTHGEGIRALSTRNEILRVAFGQTPERRNKAAWMTERPSSLCQSCKQV